MTNVLPTNQLQDHSTTLAAALALRTINDQRPLVTLLVGPQGAGKSTFREVYLKDPRPGRATSVISTDDMVEDWGALRGISYNEAFRTCPFKDLERTAFEAFEASTMVGMDVLVDRTNMTVKSRNRWLSRLKPVSNFCKVAIVCMLPLATLRDRLDARAAATGKYIAWSIVEGMYAQYVPPALGTEFDYVIEV